ncbi:capsid protein [Xanthomonas campestris]|nr:capsid protein [Xanthomonas campestris]MCC4603698.1 capsid protein [Xanthomonas campestris pv. parthenii]
MGDILTGVSGAEAATAMIAAAAIIALVGFTKWAAKKVASFFG